MRTRLDEIVEEALGPNRWKIEDCVSAREYTLLTEPRRQAEAIGKAIAERAFRHGVEQAWADCKRMIDVEVPSTDSLIYKYSHKTSVDAVQPAPAGEKCEEGRYVCPHERCQMHHPDRRKWERRKHGEAKNYVHDWDCSLPSRLMYQKDTYGAFFYDRRSGKERRR